MFLHIAWSTNPDVQAGHAVLRGKPELTRRIANNVEAGNRQWESWLLQIGGELIAYSGPEGQARIPAARVAELHRQLELYCSAVDGHGSVGVGRDAREAVLACEAAAKRGGSQVVLYTPDIDDELNGTPEQDPLAKAAFNSSLAPGGEATQIQRGQVGPSAAQMPSVSDPSMPSAPQQPEAQAAPAGGAAPPPSDQQQLEQLKQGVVGVLQQAKKMAPVLEQMREQAPELYQTVNASIHAMIEMARMLFGQQQEPVQKSSCDDCTTKAHKLLSNHQARALDDEGDRAAVAATLKPHIHDAHGFAAQHSSRALDDAEDYGAVHRSLVSELHKKHAVKKSEGKDCKHYYGKGTTCLRCREEKVEASPEDTTDLTKEQLPERHHLNLPVGSTKDHKVKVVHADGTTSWVSVRAGQIRSEDGHTISSRNPGGR